MQKLTAKDIWPKAVYEKARDEFKAIFVPALISPTGAPRPGDPDVSGVPRRDAAAAASR